ncbi:MAG: hypothetical protein HQK89_06045 [Nitrospirae bacterium]|nr:hypothetical protein [Nitrospirota bacterium]
MGLSNNLLMRLAIPYAVFVLAFLFNDRLKLSLPPDPLEQEFLGYNSTQLTGYMDSGVLKAKVGLPFFEEKIRIPFYRRKQSNDTNFPPQPLVEIAPPNVRQVPQVNFAELNLSMTVVTNGNKLAIVNGMLVREGAEIKGFRIERIEEGHILVSIRGQSSWINM